MRYTDYSNPSRVSEMSLANRFGSLNGEMHRQQIEVLQQYCRELEEKNRYYQSRLREETRKNEEAKKTLADDWYFVRKELSNFIALTRTMTAVQVQESPLLKNIARFDQRITEYSSPLEDENCGEISEVTPPGMKRRALFPIIHRRQEAPDRSTPVAGEDMEQNAIQEILNLW